jgi:hypothetical protein
VKYLTGNQLHCPNVSTTPITAMGCRQCLSLSVVQLKGKHCQKPHCRNRVVDTFGPCRTVGRGVGFHPSVRRLTVIFEWGKFLTLKFQDFFVQTLFYVVSKCFFVNV